MNAADNLSQKPGETTRADAIEDQQKMPSTATFSVTTMPRHGSEARFQDHIRNLPTDVLEDCFLTVFHVSGSYPLLSGETIPGEHTATNETPHAHLVRRLTGMGTWLDTDVKIDRRSGPARSRW